MNALAYTFDSRKLFGSGFKHVENDIQCNIQDKLLDNFWYLSCIHLIIIKPKRRAEGSFAKAKVNPPTKLKLLPA